MLEDIFGSKIGTRILLEIGRKPYKEFYLSELSKSLKIGLGRTSTILGDLTKRGILTRRRTGKTVLFTLNRNSSLAFEIIKFANLNAFLEMPEKFRVTVKGFVKRYEEFLGENLLSVIIFGSVVKNRAKAWSDIDILIIVKTQPNKLSRKIHDISSEISDVFSQTSEEHFYTEREFSEAYGIGDDFLVNVMRDGVIIFDRDNFFSEYLLRGLPKVTGKAIEKRLKITKEFLDGAFEVYKKIPDSVVSMLGVISIHLSRAILLLNHMQPESKYEIPKQLKLIKEQKFARIYVKTRKWFEEPPCDVNKDEVWNILIFLREKYSECSKKLGEWS